MHTGVGDDCRYDRIETLVVREVASYSSGLMVGGMVVFQVLVCRRLHVGRAKVKLAHVSRQYHVRRRVLSQIEWHCLVSIS